MDAFEKIETYLIRAHSVVPARRSNPSIEPETQKKPIAEDRQNAKSATLVSKPQLHNDSSVTKLKGKNPTVNKVSAIVVDKSAAVVQDIIVAKSAAVVQDIIVEKSAAVVQDIIVDKSAAVQDIIVDKSAAVVQDIIVDKSAAVQDIIVDKSAAVQDIIVDKSAPREANVTFDPDVAVHSDVVIDIDVTVNHDVTPDHNVSIYHVATNETDVKEFLTKARVSHQQIIDDIITDRVPPSAEEIEPDKYLETLDKKFSKIPSKVLESREQIINAPISIIPNSTNKKTLVRLENSMMVNNNNKAKILIKCPYSTSGCKEEFPRGTNEAHDHIHESCPFRPLPCLFSETCDEMLPHHTYMLHLMKHQISPNYPDSSHSLTTRAFLMKEQLASSVTFTPKWINDFDSHFFLMMHRIHGKKSTGQWICWLWMFGEVDQSSKFFYDLEIFKGPKKISGTFVVQSVRTRRDKILETKSGLIFSDKSMKQLTGIGDNIMTDFFIDISIGKKKSTSKTVDGQKSKSQIFGPYIPPPPV